MYNVRLELQDRIVSCQYLQCPCKRPTSNNSLIKDATSSSKVATLDEKVASLEPKDTKAIVFCRKDDFPSLFREKLANFVCVFTL